MPMEACRPVPMVTNLTLSSWASAAILSRRACQPAGSCPPPVTVSCRGGRVCWASAGATVQVRAVNRIATRIEPPEVDNLIQGTAVSQMYGEKGSRCQPIGITISDMQISFVAGLLVMVSLLGAALVTLQRRRKQARELYQHH